MKPTEKQFSTDGLMRNVALTLIRDFRRDLNEPTFCSDHYSDLKGNDIGRIRGSSPTAQDDMDVATFKATYQMHSVLKRYRFRKDLFSDDELTEQAIASFRETQRRISAIDLSSLTTFTERVLAVARIYITKVLGVYSDEEHRDLCRFGRRASVGVPSRKACEAERWELPISGSLKQISWFDSEMSQIAAVQEYWTKQKAVVPNRPTYQEIDSLKLSLVPKSFKSLRAIMPNTTIGSYMSFGIGEIMRKRLKRIGYDIRKLQMEHRSLAARGSIHSQYVTMDLSSASDSISVALVKALFPSDWFDILEQSRIGQVSLPDGSLVESQTFCTMGIGYTFPLQTLVFLSLLKAISFLRFGRKQMMTISVYGDDMIFHRMLYGDVVSVFQEIGFVINVDKTFSTGHFRESCGGDYYHGVDVRPFQPRNGAASVGAKAYEAMLYKCINGLLMRWSEHEVRETLLYLLSELGRVTGKAKVVPANFPDDSGIKCPSLLHPWEFLQGRTDVAKPKHVGHGVFRFSYLKLTSELREENRHEPYLWLSLRGGLTRELCYASGEPPRGRPTSVQLVIDQLTGVDDERMDFFIEKVHPHLTTRSKLTGRRLRRILTFVSISHTGKYTRQSGTSCFEVPQTRLT